MAKNGGAFIRAKPNPIPGGTSPGATTISWSTGNGSSGWVYVLGSANEAQLFAHGSGGHQEASWIAAQTLHKFILYADKTRTQPLASVTVTKERGAPLEPVKKRSQSKDKKSKRASIRAAPNPVPNFEDLGTTTISWSTGDGSPGWVSVLDLVGAERLFAHAASGAQAAPWIAPGASYRFTLHGDEHFRQPLASVTVEMQLGQVGPLRGGRPEMIRKPVTDTKRRRSAVGWTPTPVVTDRIHAAPPLVKHCRGGSQVLPIASGYLCLVHDAVDFSDRSRVYLHRWLWFDQRWRLAKLSSPFYFQEPGIEFAGGLVSRGDQLIVSYGVRDRDSWLAIVDTAEILALLTVPLDARAVTRAMRATVATSTPTSPMIEWWQPTVQQTVDAHDRGNRSQGLAACEQLLSADALPSIIEQQTRRNAVFYAPALAEMAPSFTTKEITFPVPTGWSRFNPSIAADAAGHLGMVVRSSNYEHLEHPRYFIHDDQKVTRTTNYLLHFDSGLNMTSVATVDDHTFRVAPQPSGITGFEDCRLMFRRDSWWLSATVWDHTLGGRGQMALLRLEDTIVVEMHLLSDGIARHEKNWMPVQPTRGDEIFFVYSCFPTVLVRFDEVAARHRHGQ